MQLRKRARNRNLRRSDLPRTLITKHEIHHQMQPLPRVVNAGLKRARTQVSCPEAALDKRDPLEGRGKAVFSVVYYNTPDEQVIY